MEDRRLLSITVTALTPTTSGFVAQFSSEVDASVLNLYDAQNGALGQADVTLQGATAGQIQGSLVADGNKLTFVAKGGALAADTYTVTLRSASNAIKDQALGELLDGNADGTPGDNYVSTFTVAAPQSLVVGFPDIARGPTQALSVATGSGEALSAGLPVRLSDASGVTSLTMKFTYDPALITFTGVQLGADAPEGSQVQANFDTPGEVSVSFFSLAALSSGEKDIVNLVGSVPANATYGTAHVLHITELEVNAGAKLATADDAVHVVAYPGDANANQRYDAEDARLIARVGVYWSSVEAGITPSYDSGFAVDVPDSGSTWNNTTFPTIDPTIIGDVTGSNGLSPLDASDVLRQVVHLSTPNIPALPLRASITAVTPDPRNTNAGTVTITFSDTVTGVDIGDFSLTRDGTNVDISGLTVTGSGKTYTIDLSTVTGTAGAYVLKLTASGSGIQDGSGNALAIDASDSWTVDTTAPTADIVDVAPDPRTTNAGTVTITFSEAVTGVTIGDFSLTRDGTNVDISGLTVAGSGSSYTIDLSTVTGTDGAYVLTLNAASSGIQDAAGNALAANASDGWSVDTTAPTADIADVTPDPRTTNAGTVTITFSEAVTGVNIGDFALTRDGTNVDISGLTVAGSGSSYTIDLSTVTATAGAYVLTLNASGSGIQDAAGNALAANASDSWTVDTTAPTADIVDVTPDPRTTNAGTVTINFSEDVTGVTIGDFSLTRDGTNVDISGLTVAGSGSSYTIDLSSVTGTDGTYVLTLTAAGSGIQDAAGNALAANATESWTMDATVPTADIVDVAPDPRTTNAGTVTINFSEDVTGVAIGDFSLTRDGTNVDISGLTVAGSGDSYTIDLSSVTATDGTYVLTLNALGSGIQDATGNALAANASDSWTVDTTAPTADIVDVTPDPRNTNAGTVTITFSEAVTGVTIGDFALTRDGTNVDISGLTVAGSGSSYTIDFSTVTGTAGAYVLTLNASGSGIQDAAGNALAADASDSWTVDTTAPTADIVDVTPDPRTTNAGTVTISFTKDVTGVTIGDFSLTRDGTNVDISGLTVAGSGDTYTIDLSSVTASDGTYVLTLTASGSGIQDAAGNALAADATETWTMDATAPSTTSFVRHTPASSPTNADTLVFRATFSEAVTGVDAADFAVSGTTATVTDVTAVSATQYDVTVSGGDLASLNGTVGLDLAASPTITDLAGNALPNTEPVTDETYVIDNTRPATSDGQVTTGEDTDYTFAADDFNFMGINPGDTLSAVKITSLPSAGTLQWNDGTVWQDVILDQEISKASIDADKLRLAPAANANGSPYATFQFQVSDGTAYSVSATMTVNVTAVNDAPALTAGTISPITVAEDSANATAETLGLTGVTYGPGGGTDESAQTLTYKVTAIPAFVTLYKADGTTQVNVDDTLTAAELEGLTYKTVANANGTGDITWTVTDDGTPAETLTQTLAITVTAVNDAPALTAGTISPITVAEDSANATAETLGLTGVTYGPGGGTDESAQTLTYKVTAIPAFVTLYKADGTTQVNVDDTLTAAELEGLTYKTVANANGTGDITWTVTDDGTPAETLTQTLAITVTAVNDAPTAANNTVATPQDTAYVFAVADFNFADVDTGDDLSAVKITVLATAGTLQWNDGTTWQDVTVDQEITKADIESGRLRFVPAAGATGSPYATFEFKVKDAGGPALSTLAYTMTINVT